MSEISIKKRVESCAELFDFFFSILISHPLYFFYFIFFFPYFLKLILSPLFFIPIFPLLSSFFLFSLCFYLFTDSFNNTMGFLSTTFHVVFDSLRPRTQTALVEDLEAYRVIFETYTFVTEQNLHYYAAQFDTEESLQNLPNEIEAKLQDKYEIRDSSKNEVNADQESPISSRSELESEESKVEDKYELREDSSSKNEESSNSCRSESSSEESKVEDKYEIRDSFLVKADEESSPWNSSTVGSSYGSMRRKEKEWRRTLACKLFEERHNNSEGMDSLWETYEKSESKKINGKLFKKGKKIEEDEEEDQSEDGNLCCLQALKFSAGKMNLGMRKPNLVKMSKAFKGFGWLTRRGSRNRTSAD